MFSGGFRFDRRVIHRPGDGDTGVARLSPAVQREICELAVTTESGRPKGLGHDLVVTSGAVEFLVREGFDPLLGARPLKRTVERRLQEALAELLLRKESPAPAVVLKFSEGRYRPCPALMKMPPMSEGEMIDRVTQIRASPVWQEYRRPPSLLWKTMLDSIYKGNPTDTWKLLETAWVGMEDARRIFEADFRAQLAKSPYSASIGL